MKLRVLVGAAFLVAPLLTSGIASAKGVRVVELTGPGLDHPIQLERDGTTEQHADALATATGLYLALSGPLDALAAGAPPGDLGPRYVATYRFFGPGGDATIRQHLYPFSRTGVVTYGPPGQALFGTGRPIGGWYQVPSDPRAFDLSDFLVSAGLPTRTELERRRESVGVDHQAVPPSAVAGIAMVLALAVVAVGQWRARRLLRPTDRLSRRRLLLATALPRPRDPCSSTSSP